MDPQLDDPTFNPTEPYRAWSPSSLLVRVGIAVCLIWLVWEHIGADYVCERYESAGNEMMQRERYTDAAIQFSGMIRVEPSYYQGYKLRGQAYDQLEDYADEIADETRALTYLDPPYVTGNWADKTRADVFFARGHAEDQSSKYDDAIADYSDCLGLDPHSADARLARAEDYGKTTKYSLALADLDAAARLSPNDRSIQDRRSDITRAMDASSGTR